MAGINSTEIEVARDNRRDIISIYFEYFLGMVKGMQFLERLRH